MTNEEKARGLATEFSYWVEKCETLEDYYGNSHVYIEGKLLKMAKWKDKQFNKIIERIIDYIDKYSSNAAFTKNNVIEVFKTIKKVIGE